MVQAVGWASSLVLLITIAAQIRKQWRDRSAKGVSLWLFVGQTAASVGFTVYSALTRNWVFIVTNALLLVSGVCGCIITWHFKRTSKESELSDTERSDNWPSPSYKSER